MHNLLQDFRCRTLTLWFCLITLFAPSCSGQEQQKSQTAEQDKTVQVPPANEREKFDPQREAAKDIDKAIVTAKKSGRNIILDVGGEWCSWCIAMDKFFLQNKPLMDYREQNFVWVKVNFSEENENKEVLSRYPPISGYPHIFVLDTAGKLLYSLDTGTLEAGKSYDPEKVMTFLQQYAPARKP